MVRILVLLTIGLLTIAPAGSLAGGDPDPAGNGVVMMVHGHFEPWVEGPPPALEALATTQEDGRIVLHTITYSAEADTRPVPVQDPVLRIISVDGVDEVQANGDPSSSAICQEETGLPGHEGPIEACAVFDLPAEYFDTRNVVTFELLFLDGDGREQREVYNAAAHFLLHGWMESGGMSVDLGTVDETLTEPTPYLVQNLVDLV